MSLAKFDEIFADRTIHEQVDKGLENRVSDAYRVPKGLIYDGYTAPERRASSA